MLPPAEVVRAARAGGLDLVALTDHDTVAGIPAALATARQLRHEAPERNAPLVIPGIEVSSTHAGTELHFLGYFIDHTDPVLHDFARAAEARRRQRMMGMVELLAELGIELDFDDVVREAGHDVASLGRPHLARALVDRGYVATTSEAFERYLGDDAPAFLPTELLTPREAIDMIHAAGGLSVWAHPPWETVESDLDLFVEWGLQGLECYRPRNTGIGTRRLLDAAEAHDLLVTGGSDWHGDWHGPLGTFSVGRGELEEFLREAEL